MLYLITNVLAIKVLNFTYILHLWVHIPILDSVLLISL